MKKILILILAIVMVLPLVSCGEEKVAADLTWKIEDETLFISGNGRMPDYVDENGEKTERPWDDKLDDFYYIEIGEGITYIGAYAFEGCKNVFEVSLPHTLKSIGDSAFEKCFNLSEIDIPGEVENIGNRAFNRCYSFTDVIIHENIKSVGDYAFEGCISLQKVKIKNNIESIGKSVFTDHSYSYTVEFDGTKEKWEEIGGTEAVVGEKITVICSDGVFGE